MTSLAVENTCNAAVVSQGFCFSKCTNGREFWGRESVPKSLIIKRHLAVDTLGFPFFTHCTRANVSDHQDLIEMLTNQMNYFTCKPDDLPKTTRMVDNGYHPLVLTKALVQIYPQIMTKIQFELAPKPTPSQKQVQGKTGFVVVATRVGEANGQTLGWNPVKVWSRTLREPWTRRRLRSIFA